MLSWVVFEPDQRFTPTCWVCGEKATKVHQHTHRAIRDLNLGQAQVLLNIQYRKIECALCDCVRVEHHDFVEPYARVTHRLARYVYELCTHMSIHAVAKHTGLDWKTVKAIEKEFLEKDYGQTCYEGLRILAIDEISIRRGHSYMTVVLNYETGAVVCMGEGRRVKTLNYLKLLWRFTDRENAHGFLNMWREMAYAIASPPLHKFANLLGRHSYGILSHCDYPINTSVLEGYNNKIKEISKRAFGFHDNRYFALKVIQAFAIDN
jgi:transposase